MLFVASIVALKAISLTINFAFDFMGFKCSCLLTAKNAKGTRYRMSLEFKLQFADHASRPHTKVLTTYRKHFLSGVWAKPALGDSNAVVY